MLVLLSRLGRADGRPGCRWWQDRYPAGSASGDPAEWVGTSNWLMSVSKSSKNGRGGAGRSPDWIDPGCPMQSKLIRCCYAGRGCPAVTVADALRQRTAATRRIGPVTTAPPVRGVDPAHHGGGDTNRAEEADPAAGRHARSGMVNPITAELGRDSTPLMNAGSAVTTVNRSSSLTTGSSLRRSVVGRLNAPAPERTASIRSSGVQHRGEAAAAGTSADLPMTPKCRRNWGYRCSHPGRWNPAWSSGRRCRGCSRQAKSGPPAGCLRAGVD
jgi:hypothetical protein